MLFCRNVPQFGSVGYFLIINLSVWASGKNPTEGVADSRAGGGTDKMRLEHLVVPKSKAMLKKQCQKDIELNMKGTTVARSRKNWAKK